MALSWETRAEMYLWVSRRSRHVLLQWNERTKTDIKNDKNKTPMTTIRFLDRNDREEGSSWPIVRAPINQGASGQCLVLSCLARKIATSQMRMFHAAAPPTVFAILIAGLLIELRARLASPLPEAPPGVAVSMRGNTAMQSVLIWAETRWPGPWVLPVLCVGALGVLRAVIWAGVTILEGLERRLDASNAARVRVGRWEEGTSVSGSELLAGMFT
ncbi:hypothetical protein B0F90DRAFT_1669887 [Multifurca ochricompacta]|uniref:Uncharacterized protein n=1 Tax=Multifurca ochricompacta TaxID=376703 RepID=A0AAD4M0X5_9AGAM|nr:hypothetical protein B0F90DRAFT_1669887 [Multifurca ochricompacta]